jgi:hypothetical protein
VPSGTCNLPVAAGNDCGTGIAAVPLAITIP